jgi:hypothetical protein
MNSGSGLAESGMGLLFLSDQARDFLAVIEEVAQSVKDLSLREVQGVGNFLDGFALEVKRSHVAHADPQTVDNRFAPTNAFQANNVRMFGFDNACHERFSFGE